MAFKQEHDYVCGRLYPDIELRKRLSFLEFLFTIIRTNSFKLIHGTVLHILVTFCRSAPFYINTGEGSVMTIGTRISILIVNKIYDALEEIFQRPVEDWKKDKALRQEYYNICFLLMDILPVKEVAETALGISD